MILYLGYYKPFKNNFYNNLELFNEFCIVILSYHLFQFSEFVPDK
jgi:hypothetical protein